MFQRFTGLPDTGYTRDGAVISDGLWWESGTLSRMFFLEVGLRGCRLCFSDDILRLWIEPVKGVLQHDFAWVADEADCLVVLIQL